MDNEERWIKLENTVRQVIREELQTFFEKLLRPELQQQLSLFGKKAAIKCVNGKWTGITEDQLSAWTEAFGAVDVESELKKAAAWIISNPHLAPKQHSRFINNWLAKCQDRSSIRSIPMKSEMPPLGQRRKACAYCSANATGSTGGIDHCSAHTHEAMDGKPRRMLGIIPKAVAGPD